jgi:hypothetical protein
MADPIHSYSYPSLGAPGLAPPGKDIRSAPLPSVNPSPFRDRPGYWPGNKPGGRR